jgi:MerR family transcriptional regulator, redox-sensitive transcriptional activator SoxR
MSIAPSAVRWYADHGLLPSERTAGNQRRFFADALCRVAMIRASQRVGLSIEEIREALSALTPRQAPTPEDWERLSVRLRLHASQRVGELSVILSELRPGPAPQPDGRAEAGRDDHLTAEFGLRDEPSGNLPAAGPE